MVAILILIYFRPLALYLPGSLVWVGGGALGLNTVALTQVCH